MLSCKDTVRSASDYLDGRLTWRQRLALRLHVFICDHCQRFLRQIRLAGDTAGTAARRPACEEEVAKVMKGIDSAE